jgi:hypothetical protein
MHELTLEWQEVGRIKRETIRDQQPSKYPGVVRLGRDPVRCDLVLSDPTVSGLHVEIFFNPSTHAFALRNLRDTNPPLVDGRSLAYGEASLRQGSTIYLGQLELKVVSVSLAVSNNGIPPTILMSPPLPVATYKPAPAPVSYGLQCPTCQRISPYDRIDFGCLWCGTSLAAAASVLMKNHAN